MSSYLESFGVIVFGEVDSDEGFGAWCHGAATESFGVGFVVGLVEVVAVEPLGYPGSGVDVVGGEECDAAVAVVVGVTVLPLTVQVSGVQVL